jgi:MarR family transcriptional regulator, organic hydroperoxide resistance regulator
VKPSESKYCDCLYFTAATLARKVEKLAVTIWKEVELSPSHAYVLMMVLEQPGVQPGCLAHHLQLSPSTVTRLIEKLEEKQFLQRHTEGKTTHVYPTANAKNLEHQLKTCSAAFHQKYSTILGTQASKTLVQQIRQVADRLEG